MHFVQFVTVHRTRSQDARSRIDPSSSYVLPRSSFSPKKERERSKDRGMDFISRLNATRGKKKKKSASILGGLDRRRTARRSSSPFFFSFFFSPFICRCASDEFAWTTVTNARVPRLIKFGLSFIHCVCLFFFTYVDRRGWLWSVRTLSFTIIGGVSV